MISAGGSNIGQRKNNEDRYEIRTVSMPDGSVVHFLIIADGMGGHEHGQLASRIAVEEFSTLELHTLTSVFTLEDMQRLFQQANAKINALQERLQDGIMGTTLTVAAIQNDQCHLGHVGDSRCYIYREQELIQISVDHTYYAELVRLGQLISANEENKKNVLMKALGPEHTVEGQYLSQELRENDLLVLCTDGLYNAITTEDIVTVLDMVLNGACSLQEAVEIFLEKALEQGARDNLTLILYWHKKTE